MDSKNTSNKMATLAAKVLRDKDSSGIQKKLAGSVLSQYTTGNVTGKDMEGVASNVLSSNKYSELTKSLAGSVLSQSDKAR